MKRKTNINELCIDTIRILSAEAVQKANSGHPGLPMGAAPMAYTLWSRHMKHNPKNPKWMDRDRFVLSAGHGSMLLYSLLHLFGYGLSIDDIKNFRQMGSKTPGHPEYGHTAGVEVTTGPLGQGFANAVGMAMAERHLAARFNRTGFDIVDHYTYVISGDGDMMEGISSEAASLAGTLGLGKLIVLYDSNRITIEGSTDIAFREDVAKRFEAYQWHVQKIDDGTDIEAINDAIDTAKSELAKPSLILIKTNIGHGCPAKQGMASSHGEPLGEDNIKATKENLDWGYEEPFHVPEEVRKHLERIILECEDNEKEWIKIFEGYRKAYPELAAEWHKWHNSDLREILSDNEKLWNIDTKPMATRISSADALNRIVEIVPNLIGGSADLTPSTKTQMKGRGDFSKEDYSGSNLHFGVREHAMAAIANGIAVHGGLVPYVSTFFVFSDYMKPSMRLAALMKLPVIYILTHDSIGVGEDGPTHQPVEQLAALRSIPNFTVIRPADSKETAAAWYSALTRTKSPTALILTRQNLPQLSETGKDALKGGYVLLDTGKKTDIILMASGSEVQLIYGAGKKLIESGISARVVSLPSWEIFEEQDEEYKLSILPKEVRARIAVEAASSYGWYKYIGIDGEVISIDTFGSSAPVDELFKKYGFTVENVVSRSLKMLKRI
jgi:transketolase